ncbi:MULTISPECIES: hypothetical protein [unclassified Cupriavidus]|uniref:hypothetical protein n=1 Tax=unclassified Cupriavidus TaxID=2640874 RepID=UPI00313E0CE1
MSTPNEIYYGTQSEKAMLDRWAEGPRAVMLLSNYITASEKRVAWGTIDKDECVAYARVLHGNALAKASTMQQLARVA